MTQLAHHSFSREPKEADVYEKAAKVIVEDTLSSFNRDIKGLEGIEIVETLTHMIATLSRRVVDKEKALSRLKSELEKANRDIAGYDEAAARIGRLSVETLKTFMEDYREDLRRLKHENETLRQNLISLVDALGPLLDPVSAHPIYDGNLPNDSDIDCNPAPATKLGHWRRAREILQKIHYDKVIGSGKIEIKTQI